MNIIKKCIILSCLVLGFVGCPDDEPENPWCDKSSQITCKLGCGTDPDCSKECDLYSNCN